MKNKIEYCIDCDKLAHRYCTSCGLPICYECSVENNGVCNDCKEIWENNDYDDEYRRAKKIRVDTIL